MKSASECQRRAQECMRKAETASDPDDRSGWMKLAEDWTSLSMLPCRVTPIALEGGHLPNRNNRSGWLKRLLRGSRIGSSYDGTTPFGGLVSGSTGIGDF